MESVLLFKPEFFTDLYHKGYVGWMSMAQDMGLLYHFILIVVGLLICYYGFRIYRVIVIAMGACIGAFLGLIFVDALSPANTAVIDPLLATQAYGLFDYLGLIIGAIIGGAAFWGLSWVAVFALGFVGLGFLGFFATTAFIPGNMLAWGIAAGFGLLGGALAVKLFKPFIIVITAVLGAFDFAMGVAGILVATGVVSVLTGEEGAGMWAFLLPFILMIILGIVNQVLDNYREEYTPVHPSEELPEPV
jgi:hypothetical protein